MTLTYKKGDRPTWEQMKKDLGKLIRKVRTKYRKKGWELKYIYRLAIGKKGGPHVHLLINRKADQETGADRIISELWENGHVYFASLYDAGGYVKLSEYITKPLEEQEPGEIKRYSCSRNLIRKEPERDKIKRRSLIDKHKQPIYPKARKGYYIDPESVKMGINPYTGYAYRHYTLIKIDRRI